MRSHVARNIMIPWTVWMVHLWFLELGKWTIILFVVRNINFMHQSMSSPRGGRPGIHYLGYLTQCLLLWVGNRKRFDKTQNPKGGDVWQCGERAWKLQSSSKVLGRLLLFTSFSTKKGKMSNPPGYMYALSCPTLTLNIDWCIWWP